MKDNIDYFSHDTDAGEHPKIKALLAQFGFEGYGRFWRLNELIGRAPGCKLDLSRKLYFNSVADELRLSPDELKTFVTFLADKDECGLLQLVDNFLVTERTQEDLERAMGAREAALHRRRRTVGDESQTSPDESETSPDRRPTRSTEGGEGREESRREGGEESTTTLFDFVLQEKSHLENPAGFARKVSSNPSQYPDILDRYEQSRARASPGPPTPPPPDTCDSCGSSAFRETTGVRECRVCGRHFELQGDEWRADPDTGRSPPSDFEEDGDFEDEHDEPGVASG